VWPGFVPFTTIVYVPGVAVRPTVIRILEVPGVVTVVVLKMTKTLAGIPVAVSATELLPPIADNETLAPPLARRAIVTEAGCTAIPKSGVGAGIVSDTVVLCVSVPSVP
jgi:hypothetical protein